MDSSTNSTKRRATNPMNALAMRLRRAVGIERYQVDADAKLRSTLREHVGIGDDDQFGRIIMRGELYAQVGADAGRFAAGDGDDGRALHAAHA